MATKKKSAKKVVKKASAKKKVTAKKKVVTKKKVAAKKTTKPAKKAVKKKVATKKKVAAKKKVATKKKVAAKKTIKPAKKAVKKKAIKKTAAKNASPKKKSKAPVVKKAAKAKVQKASISLAKTKTAKKKTKTIKKTATKSGKLHLIKQKPPNLDPAFFEIRQRLIVNRAELLKLIQASQSVEREAGDLTFSNEIDLASSLEGREMTFQLTSRDRNELKLIEETLFRINNGSYGDCESCEKNFTLKRLQIMPLTSLCIECQEAAENL
jgi:DnaK suppressor protein